MAHKKAAGSTRLGRDSQAKRLGIKIYGDQPAKAGEIIVRQRGLPYHPGVNVARAGDDTLYALTDGLVHYRRRLVHEFTGRLVSRRFVDVVTGGSHIILDRKDASAAAPNQGSMPSGSRVPPSHKASAGHGKPGMTTTESEKAE